MSLTSVHFLSIIHHPVSWETFLRGRKSQTTSISILFISNFTTTLLPTHTHTHPTMLLLIIRILKDKRFLPRFVLCVQYSKYANIIGRGKYLNSLGSLNNRLIFLYTINSQGIAWKSLSLLRWTPVISE